MKRAEVKHRPGYSVIWVHWWPWELRELLTALWFPASFFQREDVGLLILGQVCKAAPVSACMRPPVLRPHVDVELSRV